MRTISSIRTAAPVVARAATARSQRAAPRPPSSQDQTTMKAFGPDAFDEAGEGRRNHPLMEARGAEFFATVVDTKRILDAVHAGADLERRPS